MAALPAVLRQEDTNLLLVSSLGSLGPLVLAGGMVLSNVDTAARHLVLVLRGALRRLRPLLEMRVLSWLLALVLRSGVWRLNIGALSSATGPEVALVERAELAMVNVCFVLLHRDVVHAHGLLAEFQVAVEAFLECLVETLHLDAEDGCLRLRRGLAYADRLVSVDVVAANESAALA